MLKKLIQFLRTQKQMQRVSIALSRAATTSHLRAIDKTSPPTWEFSGFSQNGEDGILDFLISQLLESNRYFVEIGAADGLENNTAWLSIAKKWSGVMIEGDPKLSAIAAQTLSQYNLGVKCLSQFVTKENAGDFLKNLLTFTPDVFSLDIDGNDYHVMQALFAHHFQPKIIVVEYNSAFGVDKKITIPYKPDFNYLSAHASGLYYGVSLRAWQSLMVKNGYQFVSVDKNGVNAFFVNQKHFLSEFLTCLKPLPFAENFYQRQKTQQENQAQFKLIENMPFEEITA